MAGPEWQFSHQYNEYYYITQDEQGNPRYVYRPEYLAHQQQQQQPTTSPPANTREVPRTIPASQAAYGGGHSATQPQPQPYQSQVNSQEAPTTGSGYRYSPTEQINQPRFNAPGAPTTSQAGSSYRPQQTNQRAQGDPYAPQAQQQVAGHRQINPSSANTPEIQRSSNTDQGGYYQKAASRRTLEPIPGSINEEVIVNPGNPNAGGTARAAKPPPTTRQKYKARTRSVAPGTADDIDPDYRAYPAKWYELGMVFLTYWTEPAAQNFVENDFRDSRDSRGGTFTTLRFGERVYSKFQRFAVIFVGENHVACVPITTYGNQATLKRGVNASQHAIIYTGAPPGPSPLVGENGITKQSIKVVPRNLIFQLDPESRINFAKVYTVECYKRIKPIGKVANTSMAAFVSYSQEFVA